MVGQNIPFGLKPSSAELNVTNQDSIKKYLAQNKPPDLIIHLVALNIRECEKTPSNAINVNILNECVSDISLNYNIDKKNIIKDFFNYIIRNHPKYLSIEFLNFVENLMHSQIQNNNIYIYYSLSKLSSFLST